MKLVSVLLGLFLLVNLGCAKKSMILITQKDKYSYALGMNMGQREKNKKSHKLLDPDAVAQGVLDTLSDNEPLLTEEEHRDALIVLEKKKGEIIKDHRREIEALNEKNRKEGELFLSENSKKEGVVTLPSGLQYKVLREGTGETPTQDDSVIIKFRVTAIDGTVFDSSERYGELVPYKVKHAIAGLKEALQLMKEGSRWQLYIPTDLAFGEFGDRQFKIPAYSTLLYEVDLISVERETAK